MVPTNSTFNILFMLQIKSRAIAQILLIMSDKYNGVQICTRGHYARK
jgi:hypothetical protein